MIVTQLNSTIERSLTAACYGVAPNTVRAYRRALIAFTSWLTDNQLLLNRETVQRYMTALSTSASSRNQTLSAIKRLSLQAAEHGWLDWNTAQQIDSLRSAQRRGVRSGVWLSKEQAQSLLLLPDSGTLKGIRDRAILALLVGCGLRRSELCALTFEHFKITAGRWYIANLQGKGNRVRTILVPEWVMTHVNMWRQWSGLEQGFLIRSFTNNGSLHDSISESSIWDIVATYSQSNSQNCAPHDLRRTFAKLARKGGAPLESLQHTLGHASLTTTERYVNAGEEADAGDYLTL